VYRLLSKNRCLTKQRFLNVRQVFDCSDILTRMSDVLQFATDLAYDVGDMLVVKYFNKHKEIKLKGDHSLVTEADLEADQMIRCSIIKKFPSDVILSEESSPEYPDDHAEAGWIVDPLDGTTNFSLGLHIWGVCITRIEYGSPVMTVMYFPIINEMYVAEKGKGAFLNGDRLLVWSHSKKVPLPFFACCSRTFRLYDVKVRYKVRILGSAAYTFCTLGRGAAVLAFEATPKIWDIAGAWILIEEAGGLIELIDGTTLFPLKTGIAFAEKNYPTLAAANRKEMLQARQLIIYPK